MRPTTSMHAIARAALLHGSAKTTISPFCTTASSEAATNRSGATNAGLTGTRTGRKNCSARHSQKRRRCSKKNQRPSWRNSEGAMGTEIERKFLVRGDAWRRGDGVSIKQGYLARERGYSVRVRLAGDKGTVTIKSGTDTLKRSEFEYGIPAADAAELLKLCKHTIEKTRRVVDVGGTKWEVDEFSGENAGL